MNFPRNRVALILPDGGKKNYGPFLCGSFYNVVGEGLDFYILKLKGKRVFIDKGACEMMDKQNFESKTLLGMKQEIGSWGESEADDYED